MKPVAFLFADYQDCIREHVRECGAATAAVVADSPTVR